MQECEWEPTAQQGVFLLPPSLKGVGSLDIDAEFVGETGEIRFSFGPQA